MIELRNALTNREYGHLNRLIERRDILAARVINNQHRNHQHVEWQRDLAAIQWAIDRLSPPKIQPDAAHEPQEKK